MLVYPSGLRGQSAKLLSWVQIPPPTPVKFKFYNIMEKEICLCDNCEKPFEKDDMRMLDSDWWLCQECFEKGKKGYCEYSDYCEYTGNCDYAC
jgi:hypothetical protein